MPPSETNDKSPRHIRQFALIDKYTQDTGQIFLSGIQALLRLPIDQHRSDQRRGLRTAALISGYRGSPLGGLDTLLQQQQSLLSQHNIHFLPAVNEELGATAILGSQIANLLPQPKYDGVFGMWYGKAPGVDRSGDIFKHANYTGVGQYGGVLALAGDDPISKSSTLPSHSEIALYDALFPILYPGSVQDILDLGRLGFELSRYSGLWVGFKITTNVADEFSTAEVSPERIQIKTPEFYHRGSLWKTEQNLKLLTPYTNTTEREIHEGRLEAAKRFATENHINRITVNPTNAWIGIAAAGKTYFDVREALSALGFTDAKLQDAGIRLLKIGMLFPLEPQIVKAFAADLEELVIIEEKRSFVELFLRDILYSMRDRPRIIGKRDEHDRPFVQPYGELDADSVKTLLIQRLQPRIPLDIPRVDPVLTVANSPIPLLGRTPYFCSGCPHNTSTMLPEGSLAGAGIGCHTMALLMERETIGLTQMGGEGAQWVGASRFSEMPHIFQNIGDGTLFHSGSLAIRQAIAAGTNITYKILYNSAVAMTGGQDPDGAMSVPALTRALRAEGVGKIIITTPTPKAYQSEMHLAEGVEVWHRDRLDEAQRLLRETPGVTILIHDQECAAELRRKRKRGLAEDPPTRIYINEAVCEGCGDCGEKSNCLSVFPVDTEFGRKTQIHQSSCNKDYTCVKGDCPAFLTVLPAQNTPSKKDRPRLDVTTALPDPVLPQVPVWNIYIMGIGGTGVVTANQILATAAMLDNKFVRGLDQTGLSQKGGPVVGHLRVLQDDIDCANRIASGQADCFLVFDLLAASDPANLSRGSKGHTKAVISTSQVPTGKMITSTDVLYPGESILLRLLNQHTSTDENVRLDANMISEMLFGTTTPSNLIVVGAAYQVGLIPIRAEAIESAIQLNGTAVQLNLHAFRAGRRVIAEPHWMTTLNFRRPGEQAIIAPLTPQATSLLEQSQAASGTELYRLLEVRIPELIAYQSRSYAQQYVDFIKGVLHAETAAFPGKTTITEAVARYMFKLMTYKDEYEVARLHLRPSFKEAIKADFGEDITYYYMLHPPFLRALGMQQKLKLGKWFELGYKLLMRLRWLRGTPFDPFGYAKVRRVERGLINEYRQIIEHALQNLNSDTYESIVSLATLPDLIRGYEEIKLRNVEKFRSEAARLGYG